MRGVHLIDVIADGFETGSSPHARGPPFTSGSFTKRPRIIPACAGSTVLPMFRAASFKDHPRMRGVHSRPCFQSHCQSGSSPHARGPLSHGGVYMGNGGIIPACAGSTLKKARKNAILEGITLPFHLTSQTQPLSTGNLPTPDVPVFPVPDDQQPQTICNLA